ncbi:hypothetical protein [Corynebacterium timonense]|uniref:Uncharacterized protein n=1 Tax=Corynebacterium timonense TaxID=441500 RepID=A0A1H1P492_9CORY|nr:hypothetical protein [Corynebacterium timonense]SDS05805.1 hypothetical protein SAMN04488539_0922 [Corynebacterium timonense]
MIPVQLRAGGAFLTIALVLVIYAAVWFFRGEPIFPITPQVLSIVAAAALFGANATFVRGQERSRGQVIALACAVLLVIVGVALPAVTIVATQTFWLVLWAAAAAACALILRRSAS